MNNKKSVSLSLAAVLILAFRPLASQPAVGDERALSRIEVLVGEIAPRLIDIRRDLHAHPELSGREFRTAALVADFLRGLGLEVRTGIGGTGVLGVLRGGKPGPTVGFRGDMDALPITEETGLPFASRMKDVHDGRETGVMHACGHDIHTTVLLGVAEVLSRLRQEVAGTVLFIAQPAEEEGDGALAMIQDGVFRDFKPQALFAFHVDDTLPAGRVSYVPGYAGANCDGFKLVIRSSGCHGANPHLCVDPIVVGAQVVVALQAMLSREIDVRRNAVITVGSFHAGSASNVIPREAVLSATVRSYGDDQRRLLREKIERLVEGLCRARGAEYDLNYHFGTIALYNDPALLEEILPSAAEALGGRDRLVLYLPDMGGEDFSYFAREAPGAMLGLGVVPEGSGGVALHSPTFVADEAAVPLGVKVMSAVILNYLARRAR
ncbi:MAG: amidohydrolase [Candidatus Aminicenantes bacterium]|nr:amidohydrolase [Candidatus Aminicenantes bacterium]